MGKLLAVAGLTMRAAVRTRWLQAAALLALLVVLLVPAGLYDDGTLTGRLRLLLTYTLGIAHGLLCVAMVWVAADTICRELDEGRIALLATKPLRRWQFWLGKWLGVAMLAAVLVAVEGVGVWLQVQRAVALPRWSDDERREATDKVLCGRAAVRPVLPDFPRLADEEAARRQQQHEGVALDPAEVRRSSLEEVIAAWQSVPAGGEKEWRYERVRPPRGSATIELRVRFRASGWVGEGAAGRWLIRGSASAPEEQRETRLAPDVYHTLSLPAGLVGPDGVLLVRFENRSDETLVFSTNDGPLVLYRVTSFAVNYVSALLVLWLQLAFLAALGLAAGSAFSYPVAAFVSVAYLVIALHATLLAGGQGALLADHYGRVAMPWAERFVEAALRFGLWLTAALHRYAPADNLARGLVVENLPAAVAVLGLCQTGLVALFGIWVWSTRELGLRGEG